LPLQSYVIGADLLDPDHAWQAAYGVGEDGAVLVRPDGYVAWRSAALPDDPAEQFAAAMNRIFGRAVEARVPA
jgi:putative polyketide hydroxylase